MLGKLLKYEIPSAGRYMLPLYLVWTAVSVMLAVSVVSDELNAADLPYIDVSSLMLTLYMTMELTVFAVMVIVLIQRFRKSCLGDEAYFNLTLPAGSTVQIMSRLVSAIVWTMITIIVAVFTVAIIMGIYYFFAGSGFRDLYRDLYNDLTEGSPGRMLTEYILILVFALSAFILKVYASLCIGHRAPSARLAVSTAVFIGFSIPEGLINSFLIRKLDYVFDGSIGSLMFILVLSLVYAVIYFMVSKFMLDRHLDLP